eukprot:jgi/Bigna1/133826/aug1.22_g8534
MERYFHPNFTSHYSFGRSYTGIPALKETVASTIKAYPDLKIYVTDCFCVGNDIDGYKTEWQYVAEWIQHDELSLVAQLGIDLSKVELPNTHAKPNHNCDVNRPSWGWKADEGGDDDSEEIKSSSSSISSSSILDQGRDVDPTLPLAKGLVKGMDSLISNHVNCWDFDAWSAAMKPFWDPDLIYDTNWTPYPNVLGNSSGGERSSRNDALHLTRRI